MRVLSESYLMNTNTTGFKSFPCVMDKSSLSIRRVKTAFCVLHLYPYGCPHGYTAERSRGHHIPGHPESIREDPESVALPESRTSDKTSLSPHLPKCDQFIHSKLPQIFDLHANI